MRIFGPIRIPAILAVVFGSVLGFFPAFFIGVFGFAGKGYTYNKFGDVVIIAVMLLFPLTFYLFDALWKQPPPKPTAELLHESLLGKNSRT